MEQMKYDTPDGNSWHVESCKASESAERVVLIPSGEGDCQSYAQVASILCSQYGYNVTTFDMPGMSRTTGPPSSYTNVTPELYATQVATLLRTIDIKEASFFGSSSGGVTALALEAYHPDLVKCSIVHECPLGSAPAFARLVEQTDEEITKFCENLFATVFVEEENDGRQKWAALGADYHARLAKNYVTWLRGLAASFAEGALRLASQAKLLQKRPVYWTVGALNNGPGMWQSNFDLAKGAGLEVNQSVLQSLHFPHVTVPEQLAKWIDQCVKDAGQRG